MSRIIDLFGTQVDIDEITYIEEDYSNKKSLLMVHQLNKKEPLVIDAKGEFLRWPDGSTWLGLQRTNPLIEADAYSFVNNASNIINLRNVDSLNFESAEDEKMSFVCEFKDGSRYKYDSVFTELDRYDQVRDALSKIDNVLAFIDDKYFWEEDNAEKPNFDFDININLSEMIGADYARTLYNLYYRKAEQFGEVGVRIKPKRTMLVNNEHIDLVKIMFMLRAINPRTNEQYWIVQTTDNKDPLISYNYANMSMEDFSKMINEAYFNEFVCLDDEELIVKANYIKNVSVERDDKNKIVTNLQIGAGKTRQDLTLGDRYHDDDDRDKFVRHLAHIGNILAITKTPLIYHVGEWDKTYNKKVKLVIPDFVDTESADRIEAELKGIVEGSNLKHMVALDIQREDSPEFAEASQKQ